MDNAPLFSEVAMGPDGGQSKWLTTSDGVRIRVVAYSGGANGTVLMFPGRTEYCEKYGQAARDFQDRGLSTLVIDWRGQGLADRLSNDHHLGHVNRFSDYQIDVAAMLDAARALNLPRPWHLVGHSMGGAIGLRSLYDGLDVDSAVFSAPMWGIQISPWMRPFAWAISGVGRHIGFQETYTPGTEPVTYVKSAPFDENMLTTDREMFDYMQAQINAHPELALGGPSLQWLNEALQETLHLSRKHSPPVPAMCFMGTAERIVQKAAIFDRMDRWADSPLVQFDGAEHEVMMEIPDVRQQFFDQACAFFQNASVAAA
jgi:lysophospholipase